MTFIELVTKIDDIVWGVPLLVLLVGTGLFLTLRLRFLSFRKLPLALKMVFTRSESKDGAGDITHFQALMTALAATIGTGNIVGVATAVFAGGPGAVFWMWVTALVGMATKYGEAVLAVKYRIVDDKGEMAGGPMYYLERGLKMKWLGVLFAVFGAIAAFGIGNMVQSNSVAGALNDTFNLPLPAAGIILAVCVGVVTLGGIKSIGRVSEWVVPIMAVIYVIGALVILLINIKAIPAAIVLIVESAFTGHAALGGFLGATMKKAIQMGVARGVFSNESGLGSAPIAAAAAKTDYPVRQALVSMTGTFLDTIIVCSMTGLVLVITGAWASGKEGVEMTRLAFGSGLPGNWGGFIVSFGIIFFAYSTILGWSYYGEKCMEYLFGLKLILPYRILFVIIVFIGSTMKLDLVWKIADIMNGLMAVPNLIGLLGLSGVIVAETKLFFDKISQENN
ncbi:MAG: sodium:alanine symporter family protein [Desulfitobacteriaceae bacterium]|nr:sodium:alanine symporter family protein [Desulfitobacteriaceae bacterium]MDD4751680.1 sodium:alanine symporter family protein [Desulfitobacteriaceae bacterium]